MPRRTEGDPVVAGVEDEQRDVSVLGKQVDESMAACLERCQPGPDPGREWQRILSKGRSRVVSQTARQRPPSTDSSSDQVAPPIVSDPWSFASVTAATCGRYSGGARSPRRRTLRPPTPTWGPVPGRK